MEKDEKGPYKCANCGRIMQIKNYSEFHKCPYCYSKTVYKRRPETVRHVRAR